MTTISRGNPFPWRPWALVTLVTFAFAVPRLLEGLNIVTAIYSSGAARFWTGGAPYGSEAGGDDLFKYSPLFALLYWPLWKLADRAHALLWGLLNSAVFWAGVFRWHRLERGMGPLMVAAWIVCSMELNGPLLYQQINPLLIGLSLVGLSSIARGEETRGGASLAIGANLKLLPGIFLAPLALSRPKLLFSAAAVGALTLLLPAIAVGWSRNFALHVEWLSLLRRDAGGPGMVDLGSVATAAGIPFGETLRWVVLLSSLLMLTVTAWRRPPDWGPWISLASAAILLSSPRTESPTFVLVAPSYLFLARAWAEEPRVAVRSVGLAGLAFAAMLITVSFNDIWPKSLWNPHASSYACKTWGTLILWGLSVITLARNRGRGWLGAPASPFAVPA